MVDGTMIGKGIGERVEFFRTADLVCIEPFEVIELSHPSTDPKDGTKGHAVHAIYGRDKIVTSFLPESEQDTFFGMHSEKLVFCKQKPYIISGESGTPNGGLPGGI